MDPYRLLDVYKATIDERRPFEQFIVECIIESQKRVIPLLHMIK